MPLEKFFSGEQPINVKDLTIENPEKKEDPWFDPEKEMTEEDWQKIKELLEKQKYNPERTSSLGTELDNLCAAKILSPERFAEFNIDKEDVLANLKKQLKSTWASESPTLTLWELSSFKQAFPEKASEIEACYDWNDWNESKNLLTELRREKDWGSFMEIACRLKILRPGRTTELGLDDEAGNGMKAELAKLLEQDPAKYPAKFQNFARLAAAMRLLYPEKFGELEMPQKKAAKDELRELQSRHDASSDLLCYAADLKILSAEEAYIDDNGMIVVNMRKKPKPELEAGTPSMPEKRNF